MADAAGAAAFDWARLFAGGAAHGTDFMHADVSVRRVPGRGWGVVATRELAEGALVMACRPVAVGRPDEGAAAGAAHSPYSWARGKGDRVLLLRRIRDAIVADASGHMRAEIRALSGCGDASGAGAGADPSVSDDDVVAAVCEGNAFSFTPVGHAYQHGGGGDARPVHDDGELVGCGLWLAPSRLNHSCAPNCKWSHVGDVMCVRATQRVAAGAELTHSYVGVEGGLRDGARRRARLRAGYGFDCACALCAQELALEAQLALLPPPPLSAGSGGPPAPQPHASERRPALASSSRGSALAWWREDTSDPDGLVCRTLAGLPHPEPALLKQAVLLAVGASVSVASACDDDCLAARTAAVPLLVRVATAASMSALPNGAQLASRWLALARDCAWQEGVRGTQLDEGVKAALLAVLLTAQQPPADAAAGCTASGRSYDAAAAVQRLQGAIDQAKRAFAWAYPPELFAAMPALRFFVDEANHALQQHYAAAAAAGARAHGPGVASLALRLHL